MTIQDLKDRGLIIFECITGSNAYGTNLPESTDRKFTNDLLISMRKSFYKLS